MGCGFDIMGMTLDAVGDVLKVEEYEGDGVEDGIRIENRTAAALPEAPARKVITPALRAFKALYCAPRSVWSRCRCRCRWCLCSGGAAA